MRLTRAPITNLIMPGFVPLRKCFARKTPFLRIIINARWDVEVDRAISARQSEPRVRQLTEMARQLEDVAAKYRL